MQTELVIGDLFESKATIQAKQTYNQHARIPEGLHDKFIPRGEIIEVIDVDIDGYIKVKIGNADAPVTSENIRYIERIIFEKRAAENFLVAVVAEASVVW